MIELIILSKTDSTLANNLFNNTLANEPATLILVIGNNAQSNRDNLTFNRCSVISFFLIN